MKSGPKTAQIGRRQDVGDECIVNWPRLLNSRSGIISVKYHYDDAKCTVRPESDLFVYFLGASAEQLIDSYPCYAFFD